MSTYKYGSLAQAHDNKHLNVPNIHWLGLKTSKFAMNMAQRHATSSDRAKVRGGVAHSLMNLRPRDRKKAMLMLENSPIVAEDGPEREWREELQKMLILNVKAEIEVLYDIDGELDGWLDRRLKKTWDEE